MILMHSLSIRFYYGRVLEVFWNMFRTVAVTVAIVRSVATQLE